MQRKGVRMLARGLAVAALIGLCAPSAVADHPEDDPSDILGVWSFQTQPYRDGSCLMLSLIHI